MFQNREIFCYMSWKKKKKILNSMTSNSMNPYLLHKIKEGMKEIYYIAWIPLSNYTLHVRGLSAKCEKCHLFATPLSRYLTTLKFIETKERKTCHRNIK